MSQQVLYSCPSTFYDNFDRKGGQQWTTHYCPGCGHGQAHKFIAEAIAEAGMEDRTVFISPVGCAVFGYYYFDAGNVQAAHGRCPAVATALKRAHPESLVIGYQGDGDLAAIGGNEILQAANRGENITIFFINNAIYGMTGGQMAPTTLVGMKSTTSPEGRDPLNEGFPMRVCELLGTLDAPYYLERVALGDAKHNNKARKAVKKAIRYQIENKGFSLVEILSPCPTSWKMSPVDSAKWNLEVMTQTFPLGVFRDGHDLNLGHPRLHAPVEPERVPELIDAAGDEEAGELPDHGKPIEDALYKFSGFGGQGVLLIGMILAQAGMLAKRQVSWMPSYGPEMRGGTAHCNLTISDREIGSPVVQHPDVLVAMNGPSLEKFGGEVKPGGTIIYNSSMVEDPPMRVDVEMVPVPANELADQLGNPRVANMVMMGALLSHGCVVSEEAVVAAMPALIKSHKDLIELNQKAIRAGMNTDSQVRLS